MPCAQDGSTLPDLRIVLGNWLAFAMIGNPRGATGTGIGGTGGSITRGDRLICASGHGLTWMGGVPWFKGYGSGVKLQW